MSFFNTIGLAGERLKQAIKDCKTQEDKVFMFLRAFPHRGFTAYEIRDAVLPKSPRTSAVRALCNLRDEGVVEKTDVMVIERHGKPNHLWAVAKKLVSLQMSLGL